MNFASIPKFCISLKHSSRRHTVKAEFDRAGITNVAFFDAIDKRDVVVPELSVKRNIKSDAGHMPGILACMLSHVALIKKAKELQLPEICIFEDDVVFSDDFHQRIAYIEALDFDYDMFTLGGHFQKPDSKFMPPDACAKKSEDPHLFRIFKQGGTYAYIIKSSVYDFIIRNCTYNYGMDQFYADHVYKRFNCYAFVPFLCACTNGKSEITDAAGGYENIQWYYEKKAIFGEQEHIQVPSEKRKVHVSAHHSQTLKKAADGFIDLTDCTFITAVRIDSPDREFNFLRVMQYLCDNFVTNIIIKESARHSKVVELMQQFDRKKCKVEFIFEKNDSAVFHRTKLLNEMLINVKTKITVNYDIDVFMPVEAYVNARDKILAGWDLVYPFKLGDDIQKMVTVPEHLKGNWSGQSLFNPEWLSNHQTYCGHVQFFNTTSYIAGGMENEGMISYGPEDRERCERFQRLGYKVCWMDSVVYHIEHARDENSSTRNPHFGGNETLMDRIRAMSDTELKEYYKNAPYLKKYKHATV